MPGQRPTVPHALTFDRNVVDMTVRVNLLIGGRPPIELGWLTEKQIMLHADALDVDWDAVRAEYPELWGG